MSSVKSKWINAPAFVQDRKIGENKWIGADPTIPTLVQQPGKAPDYKQTNSTPMSEYVESKVDVGSNKVKISNANDYTISTVGNVQVRKPAKPKLTYEPDLTPSSGG